MTHVTSKKVPNALKTNRASRRKINWPRVDGMPVLFFNAISLLSIKNFVLLYAAFFAKQQKNAIFFVRSAYIRAYSGVI